MLTAMMAMRVSVPASVEPGLKPNHPKARMNVPSTAIGMLWPGMGWALPSGLVLADARAEHLGADERRHAAHHVHHGAAREVDVPVPEAEVVPELGQPAAAPDPVGVDADR